MYICLQDINYICTLQFSTLKMSFEFILFSLKKKSNIMKVCCTSEYSYIIPGYFILYWWPICYCFTSVINICCHSFKWFVHKLFLNQSLNFTSIGLVLSLRLLNGDLIHLQQESPLLFKNLAITHKLGFSDVIMPGKHFISHCVFNSLL